MEFYLPPLVLLLTLAGISTGSGLIFVVAIAVGLVVLGRNVLKKIAAGQYSLDYIAILAMLVSLATRELLAGSVISLMILVSEALDAYSAREAEAALKGLVEKIPKTCQVKTAGSAAGSFTIRSIHDVREGDIIFIRPSEIVPLDGRLVSDEALMDEANLTGELAPQPYRRNQFMKSGVVNAGPAIEVRVVGDFSHSAYQKIVGLVQEARRHPARTVRLAERYNYGFTAVTLALAALAYFIAPAGGTGGMDAWTRLLAVLVLATPCPLLIAAPVSFLGGLNKASKKNIIVKQPAALETLSRITTIFFDKTGTLTLGEPRLQRIEHVADGFTEDSLLAAAAAIEFHSLHPLAKAVVRAKHERGLADLAAEQVSEHVADGISGTVEGRQYLIQKSAEAAAGGIAIDVLVEDAGAGEAAAPPARHLAGRFVFEDQIKPGTAELLAELKRRYAVAILTGDTAENAERLFGNLGVDIRARCLPEDKFAMVKHAQAKGGKVMMVGDGLNDAPALALADAGVVFSGTENSAAIEAAAVAILNRNIGSVKFILGVARNSTRIARESILWGIGLSVAGMAAAALGYIPPVTGAILQEGIDVAVILNALRAAG